MAAWSQVFDDGQALDAARRRARGLLVGFALVSGALVSAAPLAAVWGGVHAGAVALACGALLCASAAVVLTRLGQTHRRLWRFEVSVHGLAATDAAGRRTALLWRTADRVDLSDAGLTVSGWTSEGHPVEILAPGSMPGYGALARQAVACAHAHRRPMSVDGCPVGDLALEGLAAGAPEKRTRRGGSAESPERAG